MRLALVGLASSHADHLLRHVRAGHLGDVRVTDLAVPDSEPVTQARVAVLRGVPGERGGTAGADPGEPVVHHGDAGALAATLAGRVDAVVLGTRDAATHRDLADPLLRAGLPLLVDKPFTRDPDDAAHLVRLAARSAVPLTSSSALRWHPRTVAAAGRWRDHPTSLVVSATGPADPHGPHGGLSFYAAHTVEAALAVLRGQPGRHVSVTRTPATRTAVVTAGRDVGVLTITRPARGVQTPFHLAVASAAGREDAVLELGPDYLLPPLLAFVTGVRSGAGVEPSGADLVASVRVLAELCG